MTDDRRREVGESDAPVEDELHESFDSLVDQGAQRLQRKFGSAFITGLFGGLEVGLGVMAYIGVLHETGDHLLAGIAFGIGFIALYLAHSELFTENFLMPVAAVAGKQGTVRQLVQLWVATLVANLVGGWIFMWFLDNAFPEWSATLQQAAAHYTDTPFGLQSILLALLGGSTITLMTRMQHGTDSDGARLVAAVAAGFLLAGLQLFHSILDSLIIFGAIIAGGHITYLQWLGWFGPTLLFNMVGGLGLVTALRLVRTKELVEERRREASGDPSRASHEQ